MLLSRACPNSGKIAWLTFCKNTTLQGGGMAISSASFNERLARIEAESRRSKGMITLHVGDQEVRVQAVGQLKKPEKRSRTLLRNALFPIGFVAAFVLGMLSVAISTAVRMQLVAVPSAQELAQAGDAPMIIGGVIALATSFGLAQIVRLNSKLFGAAQTVGVIAGISLLHNLAFWEPELSAQLFSPEWVALQEHTTQPDSLIFRGVIVPLQG